MKKIIIIGAGIAGLSAGIYARKAGFDAVIYEKHFISGGQCTGWDRQKFHIDNCIHWLLGTREGSKLNAIWKEVGGLDNVEIVKSNSYVDASIGNNSVTLYRDLDKLQKHLLEISPNDHQHINDLCRWIRVFQSVEMINDKPFDLMGFFELMSYFKSMQPLGKVIKEIGNISVSEYVQRFDSEAIRQALLSTIPHQYKALILHSSMASFINGDCDKSRGGSRNLALNIEKRYLELGGILKKSNEVNEIIVERNKAIGVRLADGTIDLSDLIIPACDANHMMNNLLKGKYQDKKLSLRFNNPEIYPVSSSLNLAFAVDADLSEIPKSYIFTTENYTVDNRVYNSLSIKHYCYEPSFSPKNKSILSVVFLTEYNDYDKWKEYYSNKDMYEQKKKEIGDTVIMLIEKQFPDLKGKIRLIDFVTPISYERYCNAYRGAWMSFALTPKAKRMTHNGKIKGLKNLYMAGQWLMPPGGGLPTAVLTGKWAVDRILKDNKML